MKKKYLLIILVLFLLIVPCSCKKQTKDEQKVAESTNIEENNTSSEKATETDEGPSDEEETDDETENKKDDKKDNKKDDKKEDKKEEKKDNKKEETKENSTDKKDTNSSNKTNNSSSSTNNKKNDTSSNNTETKNKNEETDEVDALRKNIQNTYGVTIKYGDEIGSYHPKGLTPTKMTDKNEIKTHLNYIKSELAKYPSGFFKEMKNFNMPLTIYLVTSVPNNSFAGFTDREFMSDIKITIVKSYDFTYTLNHEIMHYIDAYLECKMYPNSPYTEYTALNPPGYNYGNSINKYNFYNYSGADKEVYFMDAYGQTNVREDRAQVFRQMITRAYKYPGMFDQDSVLQKKALIIDKQIRQYYSCAKGTLTWDKIIK